MILIILINYLYNMQKNTKCNVKIIFNKETKFNNTKIT